MSKYHLQKLTSLMLKLLNEALVNESENFPLFKNITFSYVFLTKDKSLLKVYIDTFDRNQLKEATELLNKNVRIFRSYLAANLATWSVPKIVFEIDEVFEKVTRLEEIIHEISDEKRKK